MNMKQLVRTAAGTGVALAALAGLGAPALADPGNGPNTDVLAIDCEQLGPVEIYISTNDTRWQAGLVTTSNQVLVPYAFRVEVTIPGEEEPLVFEEVKGEGAPHNGRLDVCTFPVERDDVTGVVTFWATYTPAKT